MSTNRPLALLLRRNVSVAQTAGYALSVLVGLAIVMTAVQFYRDVRPAVDPDASAGTAEALIGQDYMVVSRKVSSLDAVGLGRGTAFSEEDIAALEAQPWARKVGRFGSADFGVSIETELGGRGFNSYLFFESIPDDFFDVRPSGWTWDPSRPQVPIILSKDYLALYNFGFAPSRGLPQLSEGLLGAVPFRVTLNGNGHADTFPARIVGFSSRLNTVAVPEAFMTWANGRYSTTGQEATGPSRLIVQTTASGDPAIARYLADHGLEVAGDKADNGRAAYFLRVITGVVAGVGGVICVLALAILVLSLSLLMQKSRMTIHRLMSLGYSPAMIARRYYAMVVWVNAAALAGACVAVAVASGTWDARLQPIGVTPASLWVTMGVGLAIAAIITALNIGLIRQRVKSYFRV